LWRRVGYIKPLSGAAARTFAERVARKADLID
jgi:hypothetical protein